MVGDPYERRLLVTLVRFKRADGLDPRVYPEGDGTHCSPRTLPTGPMASHLEALCGEMGPGYVELDGDTEAVTCPTCAARLAANLLLKSSLC